MLAVVARLLAARNVQLQLRFRGEHCLRVNRAKVGCNGTLAAYRGHFGARTGEGAATRAAWLTQHSAHCRYTCQPVYAVIKTGGKQERVEEGQRLTVERLGATDGDEVSFAPLLLVDDGTRTGHPVRAFRGQSDGAAWSARRRGRRSAGSSTKTRLASAAPGAIASITTSSR